MKPIAGISLPLQFKQISSGMSISAIMIAGSLLLLQNKEPVFSRKCGKIVSHEYESAFRYQFFAAGAPRILISHIFWLKLLKLFFFT
jgi:hypothetical protein